jgi:hypothetical protein
MPLLGLAAGSVLLATGCAPPACPAIGYLSTVTVSVADPAIVEVECVEGCEGGVGDPSAASAVWEFDAPGRPDSLTLVGRNAAGEEVVRDEIALRWTLADPGNPCGSSATADPVTLAP